ncbi:MAG: hypothetical protein ACRC8W_19360 [Plesiomonas shigelloides]
MSKPSTPAVWAANKAFSFTPNAQQIAQGFDYIATIGRPDGAPITDDHDWPFNQVTSGLKWVMDQIPYAGFGDAAFAMMAQSTGSNDSAVMSQEATTLALNAFASIGIGQNWVDATQSRLPGVTYTNTSGRPITISMVVTDVPAQTLASVIVIDAFQISDGSSVQAEHRFLYGVIPPGKTYSINPQVSSKYKVWELR